VRAVQASRRPHPPTAGRRPLELDKSASDLVDTKVDAAISAWEAKLRKRSGYYDYGNTSTAGGLGGRAGRPGGGQGGPQGGDPQAGGSLDQSGENSGEEVDLARPLPPDFAGIRQRLVQVLTPPVTLRIETGPDLVRIAPDGIPPRDYHTDEELSRIDEYGTARIEAGWAAMHSSYRRAIPVTPGWSNTTRRTPTAIL